MFRGSPTPFTARPASVNLDGGSYMKSSFRWGSSTNMVVALKILKALMAGIVLNTFTTMTNSNYDPQKAKTATSKTASSLQQF